MISTYGKAQRNVVDQEMLLRAVEQHGPRGEAGEISEEEGITFDAVPQLCLEYRNIQKIEHLWEFTSLTKLQLNNNLIQKIEGLASLSHLTWLDLSFNNIEQIEGLETLTKLEDLSLFSNRISCIENMDALTNLTFFAIGDNCLGQIDNVIYLRKFKNLHTLNLAGNPLAGEEHYKLFIAAYLSHVSYLDYRFLSEEMKEQALDQYHFAIEDIQDREAQALRAAEDEQSQRDKLQKHRDAFVELLNGSHLFHSMVSEDPDAPTLGRLPGVEALVQKFEQRLEALCMQLFESGLAEQTLRAAEVNAFSDVLQEAVREKRQRSAQLVADFEKHRKKRLVDLQQGEDRAQHEAHARQYTTDIKTLRDGCMLLELQLVEQLEEIMKDFERNMSDMVVGFIETAQGIFAQCRDLENQHHEKVKDIAMATLEKVTNNAVEADLPDDVRVLFVDKETVTNAVSASHDIHLLKIDNREDRLVTRVQVWVTTLVKTIQDEEEWRNRKCISEIRRYTQHLRDELQGVLQQE